MDKNHKPVYSNNLDDLEIPGVIVELDPDEADSLGAFEEDALTEEEAWESNIDIREANENA
jgi:hypothetical protein